MTLATAAFCAAACAGSDRGSVTGTFGRIERLDARIDSLVPRAAVLEKVAEGISWAEGPVWRAADASLLFSDVPRNTVYRWKEGEGMTPFLTPSGYTKSEPSERSEPGSNGLAFNAQGMLLLCQHGDRAIARLEKDGTFTILADRYEGERLNSPNDLVVRSNGEVYFTDPPFGLPKKFEDPTKELPFQGVFLLRTDGEIVLVVGDLDAPNGIALSPDERTLYVSNASRERPIWMSYPVLADGTLAAGRVFADASAYVAEGTGRPDGMKVDAAGNVFATGPRGVHVFAPDGKRLGVIETGVPTGNVAWGDDGGTLYITANNWLLRLRTTTRGAHFGDRRG